MNFNQNIPQGELERIEMYLAKKMSKEEHITFERAISHSTDLAKKIEEVKELQLGIESALLKEKMNSFHKEMESIKTTSTKKTNTYYFIGIAASLVILLGLFGVFNSETRSDKIFAKHFTLDPGLPTTMSSTNNFEFYDAMVDYKQEDYVSAIEKWELLGSKKPNNDTINYFLGVSYLAEGNTEKAMLFFKNTLESRQSIFTEDTYYYAALAEIKNENIVEAKVLLENTTSKKAKELLKELNK